MNKQRIRTMADLKDSSLLYEKDLPPFGYMLLSLIALLLIAVLVWSLRTPKDYVVKSSGTVASTNKNYIMSAFTGEITEMHISEGSYVEKGDTLFTVSSLELELQNEQVSGQIAVLEENIAQLKKLERSVMEGQNLFDPDRSEDRQYYNQYESYMSQVQQNRIDTSAYKQYGYSDEQIENELKTNNAKVSGLYYNTLHEIEQNIAQYTDEREKLRIQQDAIDGGRSEYQVKASTSGIVHMLSDYKEGMVVQTASAVGSIATENDSYIVTVYLDAADRPRVHTDDDAEIEVAGLAQNVYGTVHGTVLKIDNDLTASQDGKQSYFKADIRIDAPYLVGSNGEQVNLSNGMAVEARIIYDRITYFEYFLDLIGIRKRGA